MQPCYYLFLDNFFKRFHYSTRLFALIKPENLNVKIFDPLGKLISDDRLENISNNLINIDMRDRNAGIHFIEINNGKEKVIRKIIISN